MTTRRKLLLLLGIAGFGLAAGYFVLDYALSPTPGVTRENYDRLRVGMSMQRVQAIMGRPADDQHRSDGGKGPVDVYQWWGEGLAVNLIFDEDGTACDGTLVAGGTMLPEQVGGLQPRESFIEMIRRLLHL